MLKIKKIKFDKAKKFIRGLPRALAGFAFLCFFALLFLGLTLGAFIFYRYYFLIQATDFEVEGKNIQFDEEARQQVLKVWQEKEEALDSIEAKQYPNLFR